MFMGMYYLNGFTYSPIKISCLKLNWLELSKWMKLGTGRNTTENVIILILLVRNHALAFISYILKHL